MTNFSEHPQSIFWTSLEHRISGESGPLPMDDFNCEVLEGEAHKDQLMKSGIALWALGRLRASATNDSFGNVEPQSLDMEIQDRKDFEYHGSRVCSMAC